MPNNYSYELHTRSYFDVPPDVSLKRLEHDATNKDYPQCFDGNEYFVSTHTPSLSRLSQLIPQSAFVASIIKTVTLGNLGKRSDFTCTSLTPPPVQIYQINVALFSDFTVAFIIWFTIENYVVIIAASIPSLRPLLLHVKKQVSSSGNSYAMNTYGAGTRTRGTKGYVPYGEGKDGTLKSYNNRTDIGVSGTGSEATTKLPDSESEEYILPIQQTGARGITKRTDVSVRYDEMDAKDLERGENTARK
jgi:hypothetical protein